MTRNFALAFLILYPISATAGTLFATRVYSGAEFNKANGTLRVVGDDFEGGALSVTLSRAGVLGLLPETCPVAMQTGLGPYLGRVLFPRPFSTILQELTPSSARVDQNGINVFVGLRGEELVREVWAYLDEVPPEFRTSFLRKTTPHIDVMLKPSGQNSYVQISGFLRDDGSFFAGIVGTRTQFSVMVDWPRGQ